jgi:hypothetical protein
MTLSTLDMTSALCQLMEAMVTLPQSAADAAEAIVSKPSARHVDARSFFMDVPFLCGVSPNPAARRTAFADGYS